MRRSQYDLICAIKLKIISKLIEGKTSTSKRKFRYFLFLIFFKKVAGHDFGTIATCFEKMIKKYKFMVFLFET